MIVWRRIRLVLQRKRMHRIVERTAADHVKRLQARVVVVEPDAAPAGSFKQRAQLARSKAVRKMDSRLVRSIFKANAGLVRGRCGAAAAACAVRKHWAQARARKKSNRNTSFISIASRRCGLRLGNGLGAGQIYGNGGLHQNGRHAILRRALGPRVAAGADALLAAANPEPAMLLPHDRALCIEQCKANRPVGWCLHKEGAIGLHRRSAVRQPRGLAESSVSSRTDAGGVFKSPSRDKRESRASRFA